MDYVLLYLIGNDIGGNLLGWSLTGWILLIFFAIFRGTEINYEDAKTPLVPKWVLVTLIISTSFSFIFPSGKSLLYMGSYYVGKQVVNSEISQKLYNLLENKIDVELSKIGSGSIR